MIDLPVLALARVTLLAENTASHRGILGEHGLSWLIEAGKQRILFDLGQGLVLARNAAALEIDLDHIDAVVLSHGHYDHMGGWTNLPETTKQVPLFCHPAALEPKYRQTDARSIERINVPMLIDAIQAEASSRISTEEPAEVAGGIWVTGEIPRTTDFEQTGGSFFLDQRGESEDPLTDEQAVFFRTTSGLVVIVGCGHAGVVNTLNYIRELCPDIPLHAVVGGMHLEGASADRIEHTIEALRQFAPAWIGPNHCTGERALSALSTAFPGRILSCHAGQTVSFPVPRKHSRVG